MSTSVNSSLFLRIHKKIQDGFLTVYRLVAYFALLGIIFGVVGYIILVLFYVGSTSWGAPIQLSPTQERVLVYQPQVSNLNSIVAKQKVELLSALKQEQILTRHTAELKSLLAKAEISLASEAVRETKGTVEMQKIRSDKKSALDQAIASNQSVKHLLAVVDQELAAGLITKDMAAQRRLTLAGNANNLADSRIGHVKVETEFEGTKALTSTLRGGTGSVAGISAVRQVSELRYQISQNEAAIEVAKANSKALEEAVGSSQKVLENSKRSPYHKALSSIVNVVFVPHSNAGNMKIGANVYDCFLQILFCGKSGKITAIYDAEEYGQHPLFRTPIKGVFAEVEFTEPHAAKSSVVFLGHRPLLF